MAEMGWVRQLARSLVRNDALADDLAQDTWLVAERQQPDADRPLRPWLARVVTNLARTRRTSEARRDRRDTAYDDGRTQATPAELIERVELQRALADEVLALAEPYRSTVLLHFFEGCTSAEIARRLGIPDGTVRRRLKVALDQLREALRRRDDPPKGGWLAALVPFARTPSSPHVSTTMGVIAMKKLIGVILVLVLLLLIGGGVIWRRHARDAGVHSSASGGSTGAGISLLGGDGSAGGTNLPAWIAAAGAPARRIAGHVVFHDKPIAGAKVVLGLEISGEPSLAGPGTITAILQPVREVTTAADGAFDFGVQPAAAFTVSASAASYSAGSLGVNNVDPRVQPDHLVVHLGDCGNRMSGIVADASGGPIAKARITNAGLSGAESDASGHYSLCVQAGQNMGTPMTRVRVEADGYGTLLKFVVVVGNIHQDFLLVPEGLIVGRVTTSDGEPVPGAHVIAQIEPIEILHDLSSRWIASDRDGRFRIAGLAPGAFQVWATARGITSAHVPIVARPTKSSPEIHLVLEHKPGARVRGHVVRKGKPASGMTVMAVQLGAPAGAAVSQSDGSFVFDQLPYGATKFCVPPAQPEPSQEVELSRPEVDNVELEVTHIATISGHVTRKGKPVSGASVFYMVAPQATLFGAPPEATTDATGAYTLDVPLGPGQVMAWDIESKSFADPHPLSVASEDDQTVDIELAHAGEVRGTVVDQTGAPVPNAYVRMDLAKGGDQCEAVADANGQFACSALAGGDYFPTVTPFAGARTGFAPATGGHWDPIAVPADGTVGGIQLAIKDARLAIRGTVVDDTGAAIADVRIEAASRGDSSMGYPSALSDTSGRFEIANLAPGSYDLQARAADGGAGEQAGVEAGTTTAALKVMRPGAIEGTLTGFTSTPDVFVLSPTGQQRGGRAIVDGTTFTRVALPPGQYLVNATAGAEADGQTIDLAPGETKHVDLRNRGTGSVEGTVTELGSHAPVPGMRCDAHVAFGGTITMLPPDPSHQAFTDAAGHFVVSAPIGRARVLCFLPTGGPLSAAGGDVDVTTAGRPNLNIASVRATYGDTPGNAGFVLAPGTLPIAVGVVLPNGPTKPASLRPGDQLISIDGTAVDGLMPDGAMTLIMNHKPGTTVTLGIQRGGAPQTVKIVLGSGPLPVLH